MKKIYTLLLFAVALYIKPGNACQCAIYPGDFFASLYHYATWWPVPGLVIGKARVITPWHGYGTKLAMLDYYYGTTSGDTIISWGDAGSDCRYGLNGVYHPGDTIVGMFQPNKYIQTQFESVDDYFVSHCGVYTYLVKNDSVYGGTFGTFAVNGYPFGLFIDSLFHRLRHLAVDDISVTSSFDVSIYPNPVKEAFMLSITLSVPEAISAAIYSVDGRLVQTVLKHQMFSTGSVPVDMGAVPSGVYILRVTNIAGIRSVLLIR